MMDTAAYDGFVGIDIAAKTFTTTWSPAGPARPRQFDQTPDGYQAYDQALLTLGIPRAQILVVMEATGSY